MPASGLKQLVIAPKLVFQRSRDSAPYCSDGGEWGTYSNERRGDRVSAEHTQKLTHGPENPYGSCCRWTVLYGCIQRPTQFQPSQTSSRGGTYARTKYISWHCSFARRLGSDTSSQRTDCGRYWRSTSLFLRILWLCALRLRSHGLLRSRLLL
jgi:hypothetical protein